MVCLKGRRLRGKLNQSARFGTISKIKTLICQALISVFPASAGVNLERIK